jgi:hypothetical protein
MKQYVCIWWMGMFHKFGCISTYEVLNPVREVFSLNFVPTWAACFQQHKNICPNLGKYNMDDFRHNHKF